VHNPSLNIVQDILTLAGILLPSLSIVEQALSGLIAGGGSFETPLGARQIESKIGPQNSLGKAVYPSHAMQQWRGTRTGTRTGARTGTRAGTRSGTRAGTRTGTRTRTGTGTGTRTGTRTGTGTGTGTRARTGTGARATAAAESCWHLIESPP
jgi:hypothetical protein